MADYYCQAVMETLIPKTDITELELSLLKGYGFNCEPARLDCLYFHAEEFDELGSVVQLKKEMFDEVRDYDALFDAEFFEPGDEEDNNEPYTTVVIDLYGHEHISLFSVLQNIIRRSNILDEICIQGSWSASKMRPDGFGGFCIYITEDVVKSIDTQSAICLFRKHTAVEAAVLKNNSNLPAEGDYLVRWEIDIGEVSSPEVAAEQAFDYMQETTTATVFSVFDSRGECSSVDLLDNND